jgi:phosphate transport system permease protein
MTALPSIVAGLFIYASVLVALGFGRSGLAGALAISVMMLPIIARSAEVVLRVVPGGLREASLALGASQWHTVWRVVLPTARPALATAMVLGIARGIGETSPVLLTAGFTTYLNADPTSGPMVSLPLITYALARSSQEADQARAFGAATVLFVTVLVLFAIARAIAARTGSRGGR